MFLQLLWVFADRTKLKNHFQHAKDSWFSCAGLLVGVVSSNIMCLNLVVAESVAVSVCALQWCWFLSCSVVACNTSSVCAWIQNKREGGFSFWGSACWVFRSAFQSTWLKPDMSKSISIGRVFLCCAASCGTTGYWCTVSVLCESAVICSSSFAGVGEPQGTAGAEVGWEWVARCHSRQDSQALFSLHSFERNEPSTAQFRKGSQRVIGEHASVPCFNRSLMSSGFNLLRSFHSTFQIRLWAPGALWNLPSLQKLVLSNNHLNGSIGPLANLDLTEFLALHPIGH